MRRGEVVASSITVVVVVFGSSFAAAAAGGNNDDDDDPWGISSASLMSAVSVYIPRKGRHERKYQYIKHSPIPHTQTNTLYVPSSGFHNDDDNDVVMVAW